MKHLSLSLSLTPSLFSSKARVIGMVKGFTDKDLSCRCTHKTYPEVSSDSQLLQLRCSFDEARECRAHLLIPATASWCEHLFLKSFLLILHLHLPRTCHP